MSLINRLAREGALIRGRQTNVTEFRKQQSAFQKEVANVIKTLSELTDDIKGEKMKPVLMDAGKIIADEARSTVNRVTTYRTGNLSKSIKPFGFRKKYLSLLVGPRIKRTKKVGSFSQSYYGGFIEFGTSKMTAKPYMRPAYDSKGRIALGVLEKGVKKIVTDWTNRNRV